MFVNWIHKLRKIQKRLLYEGSNQDFSNRLGKGSYMFLTYAWREEGTEKLDCEIEAERNIKQEVVRMRAW